jgi:septum site-determining protein MinC
MQIRVRGRSFMAFVVTPEPPLALWLDALRAQSARAPGFFAGRPVIVDCSLLKPDTPGVATLLKDLEALGLGVIDVENAADIPGADPWKRPLTGGRPGGLVEIKPREGAKPEPPPSAPGLIVEDNVRSGQSILFPKGDVTVLGSVSSGAEVLAGGSIHIYGALRGRAIAGAQGFAKARIFCRKLEAELVSIDGFYQTAEDMDAALRGAAAHIWLETGRIMIAAQR